MKPCCVRAILLTRYIRSGDLVYCPTCKADLTVPLSWYMEALKVA